MMPNVMPNYSAPMFGTGFSPTLFNPTSPATLGGCPCGAAGGMDQRFMMMQQLQIMEQMLEMMAMMLGGGGFMGDMMGMPGMGGPNMGFPGGPGGFPGSAFGGAPSFGGGPSFGGAPSFGGGPSFGGAPSFGGPGGGAPMGPVAGGQVSGGGQGSVDLARRFLGRDSRSIRGQMPHFTAAGGQTNNCADFVSSSLEATGRLRGHFVNVRGLERALQQQGWRQVPANMAKPGDVWMNHSRGHTELVSSMGGRTTIGSNNDRPGHQVISERNKNPGSGVYYSKG